MPTEPLPASLAEWFANAPLGRYMLAREQEYFDAAVADIFGFNALQLGLCEHDFLRANRIPFKCRAARGAADGVLDLRTEYGDLPIESNSIDLLLLPHVLEFAADPHQILREAQRVLMPEGQIVIAGFNPWSLWGMRRRFNRAGDAWPWRGRFINLARLKDWLALLGFEVNAGRMCCYLPPFTQEKWIQRFRFMDAAGDRWWPIAGGAYFLRAVKRVRGMRVIMPVWSDRTARKKQLAAVPERSHGMHGPAEHDDTLAARTAPDNARKRRAP